jgi:hypothetical protein
MRTFKGNIDVIDFASKDEAGLTASPRRISASTQNTFGLQTPPLLSPPLFGPRRNRHLPDRWQRSHSAPQTRFNGSKPLRRQTFEVSPPPSKVQTSQRDFLSQSPSEAIVELRKEVLALFVLISRSDESPLQHSSTSASQGTESKDVHTLLSGNVAAENLLLPNEPGKRRFESMEWSRQKGLLNRELRRLLSWDLDAAANGQDDDTTQTSQDQITADAFGSIGNALMQCK